MGLVWACWQPTVMLGRRQLGTKDCREEEAGKLPGYGMHHRFKQVQARQRLVWHHAACRCSSMLCGVAWRHPLTQESWRHAAWCRLHGRLRR